MFDDEYLNEKELKDRAYHEYTLSDIEKQNLKNIEESLAQKKIKSSNKKDSLEYLDKLDKAGIKIVFEKLKTKVTALTDKTFVLTGELETLTRDQASDKIKAAGGHVSSSVSAKTDFVIAGKKPGSKYDKAKKYLTEYLKLTPTAMDKKYIEHYLSEIGR